MLFQDKPRKKKRRHSKQSISVSKHTFTDVNNHMITFINAQTNQSF